MKHQQVLNLEEKLNTKKPQVLIIFIFSGYSKLIRIKLRRYLKTCYRNDYNLRRGF